MAVPLAASGGTVMAVFLMAVLVLGYVVLWAIWHFFFRGAGKDEPDVRPPTADDRSSR
jgi:hypothetical protein